MTYNCEDDRRVRRPGKGPFQYTLLTLLVVTTLFAVVCSLLKSLGVDFSTFVASVGAMVSIFGPLVVLVVTVPHDDQHPRRTQLAVVLTLLFLMVILFAGAVAGGFVGVGVLLATTLLSSCFCHFLAWQYGN